MIHTKTVSQMKRLSATEIPASAMVGSKESKKNPK